MPDAASLPTRRARSDATANRLRILEAAREVFAQQGLDGEVREIAERAGVAVGTVYRHFDSREALLAALVEQAKRDILSELRQAAESSDPREAVRAALLAGAESIDRFGALADAALSAKISMPHGDHAEATEMLATLFRRGIADGVFRRDLDVPVAIALLESVFTSGALSRLIAERSVAEAADAVTKLFLHAISMKTA